MDRCSASRFVHFFDPETRRLACGFVDAHIAWAIHAEQVDCPACREVLERPPPAPLAAPSALEGRRPGVPAGVMRWEERGDRRWVMQLAEGGADWVEVKGSDAGAGPIWRVDARLEGSHHEMRDAFPTMEAARGAALLLAMRMLPARRDALHAQLDAVPGAWWWKITPVDDASADRRSIFSSRVTDSAEAAERGGRAAGAGWWLYVYGPGCARALGLLPR